MTPEMDIKMKYLVNNVYLGLASAVAIFALSGFYLRDHSSHTANPEAGRPNPRFATGPTLEEAVMRLEGRLDLALETD
jgi:hypothetical protein